MTIKVGDKLPEAKFRVMTAEGPQVKTTDDVFKGKKVALFAVPGAYTGTCHKMHVPSIFLNAYAIKDKGVNTIAIVSVNDAFVMNAWKRDTDQRDEAVFLADGSAEFTKAIGMELKRGAIDSVIFEYGKGTLMMSSLDEDLVLLLIANPGVNLGRLRLLARRYHDELMVAAGAISN
jgi:peroxiredoxin